MFSSSGRLRVLAGIPSDLAGLSASAGAINVSAQPSPLTAQLAAPPQIKPIGAKVAFARRDGTMLYIAPNTSAAKLSKLKAGVGFMAKAITEQNGERWYAFQFIANGPPGAFGKVSDFR